MQAARQRAALAVYERRLLGAALRQWRWVQHNKCLLRRVFGTAVELWQEEVRSLQRVLSLVPAQPALPGAHQACHVAERACSLTPVARPIVLAGGRALAPAQL